jgi:glycosyltransferase involved in cell wall biosynthesis
LDNTNNKLSDQRDSLLRERESLLAAQERLSAEREQFLNVLEGLLKEINQGLKEERQEIADLRHLIESRYQHLDGRIEYVLRRLSLKERLKGSRLKIQRSVKRLIPRPLKSKLTLMHGRSTPEVKNEATWRDKSFAHDNNPVYEALRNHSHSLFESKKIKSEHMTVMNQLLSKEYKGVVIYPPVIDWDIPLFQRPHHIMRVLAENGYLCFFCVPNPEQDGVDGLKEVRENLYLCGDMQLLHTFLKNRELIIWISLAVYKIVRDYFPQALLIYDYLDDLKVFYAYSSLMEEDHRILVETADILVTTATNLFESVKPIRKDVLFVPNGVYLDDFKTDIVAPPFDLSHISRDGKPIIGYYGALAEWFDYDLINDLASKCEGYNFVLIGPNYDGSIKHLSKRENLFWLGGKNYKELKFYLHFFDVGIIPFKINQITSSTSPLKLFEYMAGGKPIVTTDLKECRRYKSVYIGKDTEDFVRKIARALERKTDPEYLAILNREAKENTWQARIKVVLQALAESQQALKKETAKS